jgi:CheY-like chemotaxis protein
MISVLLVEDDLINQKVACRFLIKCGMEVTVASDGAEALHLITGKKYNLVLMDLQMPDMDGCETSTRIRALDDPYYKTVPIIAFSASLAEDVREKVSLHGMNDFVSKPLKAEEMLRKLNQYIA